MRLLPLVLFAGCASHAVEITAAPRFGAWVWEGGGPDGTFLLTANDRVAAELAPLAAEAGYTVRPATDDDLRQSWPILKGSEDRDGVRWDLGAADHVALANLWVELVVVRETHRAPLAPAAEEFVRSALHSTRP